MCTCSMLNITSKRWEIKFIILKYTNSSFLFDLYYTELTAKTKNKRADSHSSTQIVYNNN